MHPFTVYALGVAAVGVVLYAFINALDKYNNKYNCHNLPGPALIPWIGRIHDLPIDFMWLKFKEWADIYGPIYRTKMLGANFVVITDEAMAEEMLVKKAKVYSDRPEIKSLFDAKSTFGSMEYLPLMGKNRKRFARPFLPMLIVSRILGTPEKVHSRIPDGGHQRPILGSHGVRSKAVDGQTGGAAR
jgi:hypothetical protein|tara:strand:- start:25577 stop:26137 length:561 start_codon:yes stop_codon:yes gene_type:complete